MNVITSLVSDLLNSSLLSTKKSSYYSILDIFIIKRHLIHVVPQEIADIILDYAETWIGKASNRRERCLVLAHPPVKNDAAMYYLVTKPIPPIMINGQLVPTKLRKVRFTLKSHDQGWGGDAALKGTYQGSYTWFEAGILKPGSYELPERVLSASDIDFTAFDSEPPHPEPYEIPNPSTHCRRWFIQSNKHVCSETKEHIVEWEWDDEYDAARVANLVTAGMGHGQGFLEKLSPGHRIAVLARAMFPQWQNHIYSATVETFFTF